MVNETSIVSSKSKNLDQKEKNAIRRILNLSDTAKTFVQRGVSGTQKFSGFFDEEYLHTLTGINRADLFDEMRRSDAHITMLLNTIKNPILAANWSIEPTTDKEKDVEMQEFIEHALFNDMGSSDGCKMKTWPEFLEEALSMIDFGFSIFEIVHKRVTNHKRWGNYIGIRDLGWRSPRTVEEWHLRRDGAIDHIIQRPIGDEFSTIEIDGKFIIVFSVRKEGDNYEGIALLRSIYGNWFRKNLYRKLQAIGVERTSIGTPIGVIPSGLENSDEADAFQEVLEKFTSHETAYITVPEGWDVKDFQLSFDPEKVQHVINAENIEMTQSFLANFMELGLTGQGSFALGSDLSDLFLSGIEQYANKIVAVMNRRIIPQLIDAKFGTQNYYPKLKVSGINDKAGKEMAQIMKMLVHEGIITPDDKFEAYTRELYKWPRMVMSQEGGDRERGSNARSNNPNDNTNSNPQGPQLNEFANINKPLEKATKDDITQDLPEFVFDDMPEKGLEDDELERRALSRAKRFGIELTPDRSVTFPDGLPSELKDYGDPVNLRFPIDTAERARDSRVRFKQSADSVFAKRNSKANVHTRIVKREIEFGTTPEINAQDALDMMLSNEVFDLLEEYAGPEFSQLSEEQKSLVLASVKQTKKLMDKQGKEFSQIMRDNMLVRSSDFISKVESNLKRFPQTQWRKNILKLSLADKTKYKRQMFEFLVGVSEEATKQALSEVKKPNLKLNEFDDKFKNLPKATRDKLKAEINLTLSKQDTDLENSMLFIFNQQVDTGNIDVILDDIKATRDSFVNSAAVATAANTIVSSMTNQSRLSVFFNKELKDEIESFIFTNPDPKTLVCRNLNGRVFRADDPGADQYRPPLHFNCKSFLTVQLTGDKKNKNPDPEGLRPTGSPEEIAKMNKETWNRGIDRTRPIDEQLARGRTTI